MIDKPAPQLALHWPERLFAQDPGETPDCSTGWACYNRTNKGTPSGTDCFWQNLDRNVPKGLKLLPA
jgi:hypothetical protein